MTEVTFGLIGPLDVRCSGRPIEVSGARQRSLLAALLLRANQPVGKHTLCEAVWDERLSDRAEITLRSYVMRLRRVLGPALAGRLSVQPLGYQLRLDRDDELDLLCLQGCVRRGKSAARDEDWDLALREFRAGLALWRGEPLCDVPSDCLRLSVIPALTELRTQLWEGLFAAAVRKGNAAELVVPLQRLTEEDPLSERFSALFISALARCSRRVEALAEFRRLRRALISEQGVEPGTELQELHQRLLRDERVPARAPAVPVPRQLPHGAAAFTGRAREAADLAGCLEDAHPVVAITGFPGIGKSELAIHVARRVAGHYPDGQLYADLGGTTADPAAPGAVITRFLRALGVDKRAVAGDETERVAQYRSLLADRRMLLVLDDALDAGQVRPLVPGSESCGTLITGRQDLGQLPEARLAPLGEMTDADARGLLQAMLGRERLSCDPAAVASIIAACGGLPLALSVAGVRLAARPAWPLGPFARLLADERHRLDELCYGAVSVRARLEAACRGLARSGRDADALAVRAFPLLGRWQPASATLRTPEAAALLGLPETEAAAALETLADADLLASPAPGCYRLHPLARAFAAELAERPPGT
jgi:DNA-binding SARP family transcriptional activator